MALLASDVIGSVRKIIQDTAGDRWDDSNLIEGLNLCLKQLIVLRPDANAETRAVALVAGSQQAIPADAYRFLGVRRNMGADGLTPGRVIRNVDMNVMDEFDPDWRDRVGSSNEIREALFDAEHPTEYWVRPAVPPATNVYVDLELSVMPDAITLTSDTVDVRDVYEPTLVDLLAGWALYQNRLEAQKQVALSHFQKALQFLGIKTNIERALTPLIKDNKT